MVARRVSIALAVALLGVAASAGWAEERPFPVRVNPVLGLESVDPAAIDARLCGPHWPYWPDSGGFELFSEFHTEVADSQGKILLPGTGRAGEAGLAESNAFAADWPPGSVAANA